MPLSRRPRRAPLPGTVVGVATVSVLLCTAAVIERRDADPPLGAQLASAARTAVSPGAPTAAALAPLRVYIVLQPGDCDGRLTVASAISAGPAVDLLDVRGLVVDAGEGLDSLRVRLAREGVALRLAAAPRRLAERLRAIGHATTPLLVVVDAEDRVTYAAPLPRDDADRARLAALLPLLGAAPRSP